jgi:hypothetical protein
MQAGTCFVGNAAGLFAGAGCQNDAHAILGTSLCQRRAEAGPGTNDESR